MKIKIYQINKDRDKEHRAFFGASDLPVSDAGEPIVDSSIYDCVFDGDVDCSNLEQVYQMFNINHPTGYRARSLSVSDVVEVTDSPDIKDGFYFCNDYGFPKANFNPSMTKESEYFLKKEPSNEITVLLVEPNKYPRLVKIEDTLEAMQKVVGGRIEDYMPFTDEVTIVCNDAGKQNGDPLNRAIYTDPPEEDVSWVELKDRFRQYEDERLETIRGMVKEQGYGALKNEPEPLKGYVVFTKDSFDKPYSEEARTFEFTSDNKAFNCNAGGYSIFADSLDGSDIGVRLDLCMANERGGKDSWKIEKCYIKDDRNREMLDVIAGTFFICYTPIEAESFQSLPKHLAEKYEQKFKYPEKFSFTPDGIKVTPFKPKSQEVER